MPSTNSALANTRQQSYYVPPTNLETQFSPPELQSTDSPWLNVIEQPKERMRFRYPTETGNHGCLTGRNQRSSPKVKLENYRGNQPVYIRASLYTEDEEKPTLHVHTFHGQQDGTCTLGPLDRDMTATFQNLKIEKCPKRDVQKRFLARYKNRNSDREEHAEESEKQAIEDAKRMNLSCVRICFEALEIPKSNQQSNIIARTFSAPIKHQTDIRTSSLKIVKIDKISSPMRGEEQVFLLCDKVSKQDIGIRFIERDENNDTLWEDFGKFEKADVHHQYAIVFKTPPYTRDVRENRKEVELELYRPSDGQCSDSIKFGYIREDEDEQEIFRKRKKTTQFPGTFGEFSGQSNPSSVEYNPQGFNTVPEQNANCLPSFIVNNWH